MYHYNESGLPNVFLKNGFKVGVEQDEQYTSIEDIDGLHQAIAEALITSQCPLSNHAFKFIRIELNTSQKALAIRFGVSEQTIARYEKGQSDIPRTTDAALRAMYLETIRKPLHFLSLLELLANGEAEAEEQLKFLLEEKQDKWHLYQSA